MTTVKRSFISLILLLFSGSFVYGMQQLPLFEDIKSYIYSLYQEAILGYNYKLSKKIDITSKVDSVTFNPDNTTIATGSSKGVQLWNIATGELLKEFETPIEPTKKAKLKGPNHVAISSNGQRLLTGSYDGIVRVWDINTGDQIQQFKGDGFPVTSVDLSPDGTEALAGSSRGDVRLWNVETGNELKQFSGHTAGISSVKFNPDMRTILTTSYDRTAWLWNKETGKQIRPFFKKGSGPLLWGEFNSTGEKILTGGYDGIAWLWETATGELLKDFSSAKASDDLLKEFSSKTGVSYELLKNWKGYIKGFTPYVHTIIHSAKFSPDGRTILTGGSSGIVRLWDINTDKILKEFKDHKDQVPSVAFSKDRLTIATGSSDKTVILYEQYKESPQETTERTERRKQTATELLNQLAARFEKRVEKEK